ncbi:MAG: hypothetical protein NUV81_00580 [bacterium]|nr:hypothetical protein [bacterium]
MNDNESKKSGWLYNRFILFLIFVGSDVRFGYPQKIADKYPEKKKNKDFLGLVSGSRIHIRVQETARIAVDAFIIF